MRQPPLLRCRMKRSRAWEGEHAGVGAAEGAGRSTIKPAESEMVTTSATLTAGKPSRITPAPPLCGTLGMWRGRCWWWLCCSVEGVIVNRLLEPLSKCGA